MKIKEKIKERGMTVSEVAKRLGVVSSTLSRAINGNPSINTLYKIADIIGVHITELFESPPSEGLKCPHCGHELKIKIE